MPAQEQSLRDSKAATEWLTKSDSAWQAQSAVRSLQPTGL